MRDVHAVTGAFGFSGKYIARRLLDAGRRVATLTDSPNRPHPFADRVEARPYRFDSLEAMVDNLRDVAVLYNTYWVRFTHGGFSHEEAVRNTLRLISAARLAGVERFVHVSIANADEGSPLEYFQAKGMLERTLRESGLSYAILRPAVLFGPEDILINNIAWALRRFPVFAVFGNGAYHVQPIYVDDLARLAVELGQSSQNSLIEAVGPEDFTYLELVSTISQALRIKRPIIRLSPSLGFVMSSVIGFFMRDVFVTREEIDGLLADRLHAPGAPAAGTTRFSEWIRHNADAAGRRYANELARRKDRTRPYIL